jgi:uncharacterized protein (DUF2235 family)
MTGQSDATPKKKKRIALFLDGTWNKVFDNTNVWRLKSLCARQGPDGVDQVTYYNSGLGTLSGHRLLGGAFGYGIEADILETYRRLLELYEVGDEIFIFGFSRGAFTARSLAGFVSFYGLLKPGAPLSIGQLYRRYRDSADKATVRDLQISDPAHRKEPRNVEERWLRDYSRAVPIKMIGVWDTVGALGIPFGSIPGVSRKGFGFLHTGLRVSQENAYQALAIDEHRKQFVPTLWTKHFPKGSSATELAAPRRVSCAEQRWFLGSHANVGGGCPDDFLAQIPLRWMLNRAARHGLAFRDGVTVEPDVVRAKLEPSHRQFLRGVYRLVSSPHHRVIGAPPEESDKGRDETINETIDGSVFQRWRDDPAYRPPSLTAWAARQNVDPAELTAAVLAADPRQVVPD